MSQKSSINSIETLIMSQSNVSCGCNQKRHTHKLKTEDDPIGNYDDLCKSVNDAYRIAIEENPDIGIREFANSIGEDFLIVWECLGFADWYAFYDTDDD